MLTDHYNPANKTVNLSEGVYGSNSVAAAAVAAHECGHAVQHARAYAPLKMRCLLYTSYNDFVKYQDKKGVGHWIFNKLGSTPVYLSTVNPETRGCTMKITRRVSRMIRY